ncbi:amidase family protein [Micromonospora sp. WMMD882]|uniref:amidase n=1 Tax=Micromonospora sp. WMMD882 TaxID=3015151 RepID=UPI00248D298E|nr:amidase family protein [Micromonospora sp. WMMD882]WBB77410.1 amidase family protein [Micromonospora sp. WMMD882]
MAVQDIMPTWVGATAKQIARGVRRGDVSATQVVADHLDHIAAADAGLAAFRQVRGGEAITEAEKVDEQEDLANLPLAGVPVAVKENTPVAGLPTWRGSAAARTPVAERDHEVVRRLRGAGAVILGVTRMPELGLWAVTDDQTAVTRNPWDPRRTPGGSSGGAAAAVAAGLVPIAHGNDGLGSIRIPAACCGLVGLKPGRGVVPWQLGAEDWFGLAEHGMLTTTVADAAVGFQVLAGRQQEKLVPPQRLRVGVSLRSPVRGVAADRPNRDAVAAAGRLLAAAGHDTVPADPVYPTKLGLQGIATWFAAAAADVRASDLDRRSLQKRSRRHATLGEWAQRRGYVRQADRDAWRERSVGFFADHSVDLLLTPALASAPPPAQSWSARSWRANMTTSIRYAPFAAPWNVAGLPALVVPVGRRPDGLPVAVQLVGPPGSELLLLAVAGQFEMQAPWARHAPGYPRVGAGSPATT